MKDGVAASRGGAVTEGPAGRRILVVEDEFLVAGLLEDMLDELGAVPVGPAFRLEEGMRLAREERLDAAVLDVNLNGRRSEPIAEILRTRRIPYLLSTGYGDAAVSEASTDVPVLTKPYTMDDLAALLRTLFTRGEGA